MSTHSSITSNTSSGSSTPSFIHDLDLVALSTLATKARGDETVCTTDAVPRVGAYNVVYFLNFVDGIRWVARMPIALWSEALKKRMLLDRIALDFIGTRRTIPVPRLIDCQPTEDNPLHRPYTLTTFLPGAQLAKLCDERRQTVFRSLIALMAQLSLHKFNSIGQLDRDPKTQELFVGPFYPSSNALLDGETSSTPACGPYSSTHVYLLDMIARRANSATSTTVVSELQLLKSFAGMIPDHEFDGAPFYLSHPDFSYQNVLVDVDGNIIGIIDWDDTTIGPRQSAFARYPSWITRDWDPLTYAYKEAPSEASDSNGPNDELFSREAQQEDSPQTLQKFRAEYLAASTALSLENGKLTRNSHVLEAIEIAIALEFTRAHILLKLTEYVYGSNEDEDLEFLSFATLSRRLSTGCWLREVFGEDKIAAGGKYIY